MWLRASQRPRRFPGRHVVIPFDHRAGLAAVDQLQSVAQLGRSFFSLEASCDGLLVLCRGYRKLAAYSICNPATRQYARLRQLDRFALLGMYPHSPTGEYRLLLEKPSHYAPDDQDGYYYVFTLGSDHPPKRISCPHAEDMVCEPSSVLFFRGSLHWQVEQHDNMIIKVFSTKTESFRQMRAPAVPGKAKLFEMDGMLGMSSFNDAATAVDIWMTQDYESEAWAIKYRVELPAPELTVKFGMFDGKWSVTPSWEGDMLLLVKFGKWLLQIDMDGKLVASFHRVLQLPNQLRLKQSLVPHAFFPTLEGYVVNGSPFI